MMFLQVLFWLCVALVVYTYLGYPLIITLAARFRPQACVGGEPLGGEPVSVVVAAFNEEAFIGPRVRELARLLAARQSGGEVIVVSDGSNDRTAEAARAVANEAKLHSQVASGIKVPIRISEPPGNLGKAAALNTGYAMASHELIVFADVRQTWATDAIDRLVANFADPSVGAVSGGLVIESPPGVMSGVALYWKFEKWLRRAESRLYSMGSVTGSICAVRRCLFRPMPHGTILDDVYWPLVIVMGGHRVVHDESAVAYDRFPDRVRDEFRRKVRTLAGNFQLLERLPAALVPWRNPVCWQFVSHKVFRLLVPWALLGMLVSALMLSGPLYGAAFALQVVFYLLALAGTSKSVADRFPPVTAVASFVVLNAAAWLAFWVWILGRDRQSWSKAAYDDRFRRPVPPEAKLSANRDSVL